MRASSSLAEGTELRREKRRITSASVVSATPRFSEVSTSPGTSMLMACTPHGIRSRALRTRWTDAASSTENSPQPVSVSCRRMSGSAVPYSAFIWAAKSAPAARTSSVIPAGSTSVTLLSLGMTFSLAPPEMFCTAYAAP